MGNYENEWNVAHVLNMDNPGPLELIKLQYWEDPNFVISLELNHINDEFMDEAMTNQDIL